MTRTNTPSFSRVALVVAITTAVAAIAIVVSAPSLAGLLWLALVVGAAGVGLAWLAAGQERPAEPMEPVQEDQESLQAPELDAPSDVEEPPQVSSEAPPPRAPPSVELTPPSFAPGESEHHRLLRGVLGLVRDSVAITDEEGTLFYVNPSLERNFGHDAMDVLGQPIRMLLPELFEGRPADLEHIDDEVRFQLLVESAESGGSTFGLRADYSALPLLFTCRNIELDGHERIIWWLHPEEDTVDLERSAPRRGPDSSITPLARRKAELEWMNSTLRREAREHQRAASEALRATRAKTTFLANMSHELRTPLNAIIGYAEMICEDPQDAEADAEKILTAARHLLSMVDDVLDLSSVESGRVEIAPVEVDIASLVEEVRAVVEPLARTNANTFTMHIADDVSLLETDAARLRQILYNLLSNACKFTREGSVHLNIALSHGTDRQWVLFEVSDTGIGIDADYLPHLFEPFGQEDNTPTRRHQGPGLGLALTQRLCRLLGGDVRAESVKGLGSQFTARLPLSLHFVRKYR